MYGNLYAALGRRLREAFTRRQQVHGDRAAHRRLQPLRGAGVRVWGGRSIITGSVSGQQVYPNNLWLLLYRALRSGGCQRVPPIRECSSAPPRMPVLAAPWPRGVVVARYVSTRAAAEAGVEDVGEGVPAPLHARFGSSRVSYGELVSRWPGLAAVQR